MKAIAAVGMFDGVHSGHRHLLHILKEQGRERGLEPVVFTFDAHPLATLAPARAPELLTESSLKAELIQSCGIDHVEFLNFTAADFRSTAAEFVTRLRSRGTEALIMGFNNHIGSDRLCAAQLSAHTDMEIIEASRYGSHTSSSDIRSLLMTDSGLCEANALLGYAFTVRGRVVDGQKIGRTIGFPTANIAPLCANQLMPADGVYAVRAEIEGKQLCGVANVGRRPTFENEGRRRLEVHFIDFKANLYGRVLDIRFVSRLRGEMKFNSVDRLIDAIRTDCAAAKAAVGQ